MKDIMEHFGLGVLHAVAGGLTIAIVISLTQKGGIINSIIINYMSNICG